MKTTGPQTKQEILCVAKKLFYENGIRKTTIKDIANECNIPPSLVCHHFNNKNNLAHFIYSDFLRHKEEICTNKYYKKYGEYDLQTGNAVELYLMLKVYNEDKNIYRFFCEHLNDDFKNIMLDYNYYRFKSLAKKYHLNINNEENELFLISHASKGALANLVVFFFNGTLNTSFEYFCDYYASFPFRCLNMPPEKINEILDKAKKIFKELDFHIKPYFTIE
ncbi:MAG: TetR/AcrR family transcriptional regulator [Eubacteriales bacterium]